MNCGDRIAELRERRGMTQGELATALCISRASLSHYEKNRRTPDYQTLSRLAAFFDVSIDFLLRRSDEHDQEAAQSFASSMELSDENLLNRFAFTVDGRKLTTEESKRFIAFVRAERAMNRKA